MSSALTNDGSNIIGQTIATNYNIKNDEDTISKYEINETAEWIKENNFKAVGLQFPDELLKIAVSIVSRLNRLVDCELGVMSDTSFGSCCVDEIGAQHCKADAIVHYGHSCLTPTHRMLPTRFVFGKTTFNDDYMNVCTNDIKQHIASYQADASVQTCVILLSDHQYIDFSGTISEKLSQQCNICVHRTLPNMSNYKDGLSQTQYDTIGSRIFPKKHNNDEHESNKIIIYICDAVDRSVKTTLLSLFHLNQPMAVYHPATHTIIDVTNSIGLFLRTRLHKIEVSKVAQRVGLLVGTLSMEKYLDIFNYLKTVMKRAGKAVYPMVVGKINPAKLNNFANYDVIVVINCMESCLHFSDKSDDFYKPVVTPYEMVCALDTDKFYNPLTMAYITDCRQLLTAELIIDGTCKEDCPTMSLISGQMLTTMVEERNDDNNNDNVGALVTRLESHWSVSKIDPSSRSWFGLEPNFGKDEVSMVTQGRTGIASIYTDEIDQR